MKKLFSVILVLSMLFLLAIGASAVTPKVVDDAGLLTDEELRSLEELAEKLTDAYSIDVVIYTCDQMNTNDPEAFADDYYDYNGYGIGSEGSGILFMISMAQRDWAISTKGNGVYALTDYGQEVVFDAMVGDLSSGEYYNAFYTYLYELEEFLAAFQAGKPIDGYVTEYTGPGSYQSGTQEYVEYYEPEAKKTIGDYIRQILVSLGFGAAAGGVSLSSKKRTMKTDYAQKNATTYKKGSIRYKGNFDMFTGTHTVVTRRATERSSSGGGHSGGGSSVHHSSSGSSHGGSHGKF